MPTANVIDYLVNPDDALGRPETADAEAAARMHGLNLRVVNVVNARGDTTSTRLSQQSPRTSLTRFSLAAIRSSSSDAIGSCR
jgi:hypothetical protein